MVKSADENYERERRILYNAYEFNLNGNIKNLTGEKIDRAYLNVTIELKFKSGEIKLELKERIIYEGPSYSSWDEDTIKRIEESYFLNYNSNFSESLLNHSPEKITLKCFITATNSVGLNIDILQIAEEDITA